MGPFSEIIGWISVLWLVMTSIFFLWPTDHDENDEITPEIMNYTIVVVGGVLFLALVYWFLPAPIGARHFFVGPKREDDK